MKTKITIDPIFSFLIGFIIFFIWMTTLSIIDLKYKNLNKKLDLLISIEQQILKSKGK